MTDGAASIDDAGKVRLQFVDLHGIPRGTVVPSNRWDRAQAEGVGFAGTVFDVYETSEDRGTLHPLTYGPEDREVTAVPDPGTLSPVPWSDGSRVAQCWLQRDGAPFELCSRATLQSVLAELSELGYDLRAGAEIEFTLLATDRGSDGTRGTNPETDQAGAGRRRSARDLQAAATTPPRPYDARSLEAADAYVSELLATLDAIDCEVTSIQRESAPGQFEASLVHGEPLSAADGVVLARQAIRGVGRAHGYDATFLPFPVPDYEGNGLHFHLDLQDDSGGVFVDESDEYGLSPVAYQFVGGILHHADALTAVCAPTVNSYKRFQPGTFAPVDRTYGFENRSAMVRIPDADREDRRIEVRLPDSYANPYLSLAAIVAAGIEGIESERTPSEPEDPDRYGASDDHQSLPASLAAALDALEGDSTVRTALGSDLASQFCKQKRDEIARFRQAVTDWEIAEYVDKL